MLLVYSCDFYILLLTHKKGVRMKFSTTVLITFIFSIMTQASIPNYNPGVIYEVNILEKGLHPHTLL